ncbi:hypothetical protein [Peribacillus sp. NPDC055009]
MADIAINVKDEKFGVKGDFNPITKTGTDDSDAIYNAILYAKQIKARKIIFPTGHYQVKIKYDIDFGNLEIDLQGSTILYTGTNTWVGNGENRLVGIFTLKGDATTYPVHNISGYTPINYLNSRRYIKCSAVQLGAGVIAKDLYNIGDFVFIDINTGIGATVYSVANPEARVLTRVIENDGPAANAIYVEYYSPFNWTGFTPTGTVQKIVPLENMYIHNGFFKEENPVSADSVSGTARDGFLSFINNLHVVNSRFEDLRGEGQKFPLILSKRCYGLSYENIDAKDSKYRGDGGGYCIQNIYSMKVYLNEITGHRVRHIIDFSGSSFSSAINCFGTGDQAECWHIFGIYVRLAWNVRT